MRALGGWLRRAVRRRIEAGGREIVPREARNGSSIPLLPILTEYCALVDGPGAAIQIGAHDGVLDDPLHDTILRLGLPALLVEPLPDVFARLKRTYRDYPLARFENVAVDSRPGEAEIFRINPAAEGLPHWVHGLATLHREVLLKHRRWSGVDPTRFDAAVECLRVPVLTMADLLDRHPDLGPPMLLQVDTEGHDFTVVRSAVAAGCLPRIIYYEHKHLPYDAQTACRDLLAHEGYAFWSNGLDTLAFRAPGS